MFLGSLSTITARRMARPSGISNAESGEKPSTYLSERREVMITGSEMSWSCPLAYQPITSVKKVPLYKQASLCLLNR